MTNANKRVSETKENRRVYRIDAGDISPEEAKQLVETLIAKGIPVPSLVNTDADGAGDSTFALNP